MLKSINQILVFIIELIMLGSFAFFGFQKGDTTFTKYAFAIVLPAIAIFIWGYWAAPKSANRLNMPYLALFRLTMFLLAAYLLCKSGQTGFAIILAVLSVITQIASFFTESKDSFEK